MTQLTLFDETMRQQLERTRQQLGEALEDNAALRQRLEHAKVEYRKLREQPAPVPCPQCQALQQTVDDLHRQVTITAAQRDSARRIAEMWRSITHLVRQEGLQVGHPPPPGLSRDHLTQLLTVAHPDKWSQGQPATELAHELTVLITDVRATLEGPL